MRAPVAVAPPIPGSAGLKLVQIDDKAYLYFVGSDGVPTGDYAMSFDLAEGGIFAFRTNNPCPEFKRDVDGKILVANV